jgi:hypothetical protein
MQDGTLLALCLAAMLVPAGCANVPGASQPTERAEATAATDPAEEAATRRSRRARP